MRGYRCVYFAKKNNKLIKNNNMACWAGITSNIYWGKNLKTNPKYIFIRYGSKRPKKDREKIVELINIITECSLIKFKKRNYIKFKLVDINKKYYANLILLNYIRMLWYNPPNFHLNDYYKDLHKYKKGDDIIFFLMTCIKNNTIVNEKSYYGDHCDVYREIIPKTTEYFLKGNIIGTKNFYKERI